MLFRSKFGAICFSDQRNGQAKHLILMQTTGQVDTRSDVTLVLGPGSINQAHQPDEYLETRFIKPTRELITQVIHHFCWH